MASYPAEIGYKGTYVSLISPSDPSLQSGYIYSWLPKLPIKPNQTAQQPNSAVQWLCWAQYLALPSDETQQGSHQLPLKPRERKQITFCVIIYRNRKLASAHAKPSMYNGKVSTNTIRYHLHFVNAGFYHCFLELQRSLDWHIHPWSRGHLGFDFDGRD